MRVAQRILITIFLLLALFWLGTQARMHLFRYRAEHLLSDINALQLNQSNWSDAQTLMHRWGAYGQYDGHCTAETCNYYLYLDDAIFHYSPFTTVGLQQNVARLLDPLAIRASSVFSSFSVAKGHIVGKSYRLEVALPARLWMVDKTYWPALAASFSETSNLQFFADPDPARHPNHSVKQLRIDLRSSFTPQEKLAVQRALTDLRFRCVTSFRPCLDRAEIDPEAEQEWKAAMTSPPEPTCYSTVRLRGREADQVLVVQVVGASAEPNPGQNAYQLVRVLTVLKGGPRVRPDEIFDLQVAGPSSPVSAIGSTLVLAGRIDRYPPQRTTFRLDPCGLTELTPANLQQLRQGIEDDFSRH